MGPLSGGKRSEIDALTGGSIDAWITAQLALPFTSHRAAIIDDRTRFGGSSSFTNWNAIHPPNRQSAWFKVALTANDQLRQHVKNAVDDLNPLRVQGLFRAIPDEDCELLDLAGRPEDLQRTAPWRRPRHFPRQRNP